MTNRDKFKILEFPEKFAPSDIRFGNLRGNENFTRFILTYSALIHECQFWEDEKIKDLQLLRFRHLLTYLKNNSEFWADYFFQFNLDIKNLKSEDLRKLPILSRKALAERGDEIYIKDNHEKILFRHTSGTSGMPLRIFYDQRELIIASFGHLFTHPVFLNENIESLLENKFAVCLGSAAVGDWLKDFAYNFILTSSVMEDSVQRRKIYGKIKEIGRVFLSGFSSLIFKFAEGVYNEKIVLPIFASKLVGEPLPTDSKKFIQKVHGASLVNVYASAETRSSAFECLQNPEKFHVYSDRIILEIVDENGLVVRSGDEGNIVMTVLDHRVTPIIRYDLGDIGRIIPEKCPCGRTAPLFEFRGRRGDELELPSGAKVSCIIIQGALMNAGIPKIAREFQLIKETPRHLRLLIIPRINSHKLREGCEVLIRSALSELFSVDKIVIDIEYVSELSRTPSGKPIFLAPLIRRGN